RARGLGDRRAGCRLGRDRGGLRGAGRRRFSQRPGAGRALPEFDRTLQAAEALRLSRGAAEEQLRQGAEDRAAEDAGEITPVSRTRCGTLHAAAQSRGPRYFALPLWVPALRRTA